MSDQPGGVESAPAARLTCRCCPARVCRGHEGMTVTFDLSLVPFSRCGSYLAFSRLPRGPCGDGVYLRTVRGGVSRREVFHVQLLHAGRAVCGQPAARPESLRLTAPGGYAELCFESPTIVRIRARGLGVRLTLCAIGQFGNAFPAGANRWQINAFENRLQFMVTPLQGTLAVHAPQAVARCQRVALDLRPGADHTAACALEEFLTSWAPRRYARSFASCRNRVADEFRRWLRSMPPAPPSLAASRELAAYINWSCAVAPSGHFRRTALLMSKNWMTSLWSWDHCFNALALARGQPDLAWDQFMAPFDAQAPDGVLPDAMNDRELIWNFCKPPIHGWTLRRLMRVPGLLDRSRLREIYDPLVRWTRWWFERRDYDGDGLPQYNHGNDSGWDNCTLFDAGYPVEGPDLAAYLVIQMEVLAELASRLGRRAAARRWRDDAAVLLSRLLKHSWRPGRFVAPKSGVHTCADSDSLFAFLPIVLGARLPRHVRDALVAGLGQPGRFLTRHGLATESPRSPRYEPDGYWRGPIWAPSTMLIVDGLQSAGAGNLAGNIARRFCRLCRRSGFAENFDALTGAGLRDRAYTWTASVFLLLASEYLAKPKKPPTERPCQ